jgi:hypothetical protein
VCALGERGDVGQEPGQGLLRHTWMLRMTDALSEGWSECPERPERRPGGQIKGSAAAPRAGDPISSRSSGLTTSVSLYLQAADYAAQRGIILAERKH